MYEFYFINLLKKKFNFFELSKNCLNIIVYFVLDLSKIVNFYILSVYIIFFVD